MTRRSEPANIHQPLPCIITVDVCKGNTACVTSEVFEVLIATRKLIRVQEWSTGARARILWRNSWTDNREGRSKHREATVRIREYGGDQELHARGGTKGKFSYLPACVPRNAGNDEANAGRSARTWRTMGEGSIKRKVLSYLVVIPMSVVVRIAAGTTFFGKFDNNARGHDSQLTAQLSGLITHLAPMKGLPLKLCTASSASCHKIKKWTFSTVKPTCLRVLEFDKPKAWVGNRQSVVSWFAAHCSTCHDTTIDNSAITFEEFLYIV